MHRAATPNLSTPQAVTRERQRMSTARSTRSLDGRQTWDEPTASSMSMLRARMFGRCSAILVTTLGYLSSALAQTGYAPVRAPQGGPAYQVGAPATVVTHQEYASQPAPVARQGSQPTYVQNAAQFSQGEPAPIIPVRLTSEDPKRPLDRRIEAMPQSDQKLEVIHNRSQLVITRHKVRRMAWSDPSVIDIVQFTETELSILGTGIGTTDLWIWIDEQRRIDYGRIERKLKLLYPNSKVYLIPMSRKIIVRGQAKDAAEAAKIMQIIRGEVIAEEGNLYGRGDGYGGAGYGGGGGDFDGVGDIDNDFYSSLIVDELTIPGEFQVMVRVRIAELNRSELRRMGIDWSVLFNDARNFIGQAGLAANPVLTGIFENGEVTVLLDALASNGSARVLEDATLVVLSGEPASFLSGGEFAVPTIVGIGGAQGQQTSFRGFGTSVIATPTIVDNDLIRLQIVPELSSINSGNSVNGIPGVNVRRVQTRVELREGQTIVLGGLFSRREAAEVTRIPFLSEIPIVGTHLFNAKQATEDENELLIVVTPEIVRPMDADQVPPLPGFYVTHPDDIDLFKFNRIEGNPDMGHYHLLPYGNGQGFGQDAGYNFFNPGPVDGQLMPEPTGAASGIGTQPAPNYGSGAVPPSTSPYQYGTPTPQYNY
ncbi:Uncharacterized protein y4xJ, partial [Durusdinium trenchii]